MKEKISKEKGWEVSQQKLIYSGRFGGSLVKFGLVAQRRLAYQQFRQDSSGQQHR